MKVREAATRLHHLSMRYVGALAEVAMGKKLGFLAKDHPGLSEMRDLIDLLLLTRAEINGLIKILYDNKLVTSEQLNKIMADEYEHLTKVKAQQLGVVVTETGLTFVNDPTQKN